MGDSMEKGTNKKKTTTSTNTKKSTGTKNTTAKKGATNKKSSNNVAKKSVSTTKVVATPKMTTVQSTTKPVVKTVNPKSIEKENKDIIIPVKENKTEYGEKIAKKKEKLALENNEFTNLIKIVLIVTGIFLAFYLITYLVAKNKAKDTDKKDDTAEVSIQYDEILMSNLLKQSASEYYVLAYDAKDVYYDTYNTYITSIDELKLNSSTLIKVKDGKIDATYEGYDAIVAYLKTL